MVSDKGENQMAGMNKWFKDMIAVKAEIAEDEAAALKALAAKKMANAKGFAARAAAAKMLLAEAL